MSKNPFLHVDQQMVGDIYTSPEIMENLATLCDEFGSRFGGTRGESQAAAFFEEQMQAYGLQNIHREPVEYQGWRRREATLEVIHPVQRTIPCISLPHSPAATVEAVLIDLGDGAPADFERRAGEIKGKIVMTNSVVSPAGVLRWIHRNDKLGYCLLAGATGFIFVNHYPGYGPATGGIGNGGRAALIPGISVSYEDGGLLQRLVKRHGEIRLRMTTRDELFPATSWNVLGDLAGETETIVMLGCHYDGHDISQGAQDPASGAVAVLDAARVLAKFAGRLPCTLRFAFWGVEEIGLLGSKAYVQEHASEMDGYRFYLNMDGAGAVTEKGVVLNEWPDLEPLFSGWADQMSHPFLIGQSINAHSDHYPFLMAGVPTGGMEKVKKDLSGRGYGHTAFDTLDKTDISSLREAAALGARLALRIAAASEWPASRRSQQAVAALFEAPQYQEEQAHHERVASWYAQARQAG